MDSEQPTTLKEIGIFNGPIVWSIILDYASLEVTIECIESLRLGRSNESEYYLG